MYKVLLIDDESWVLEDLKSLICWQDLGFEVIAEASNAEDAKSAIERYTPDVVISDIRMPGLSGIQLLEYYQEKNCTFKTLFVTAYGKFEYAKKALELGAVGYLLKPVESDELISNLTKIKAELDKSVGVSQTMDYFEKIKRLYALLDGYGDDKSRIELLCELGIAAPDKPYMVAMAKTTVEAAKKMVENSGVQIVALPFSQQQTLLFVQSRTAHFNIITFKNILQQLRVIAKKQNVYMGVSRIMHSHRKFRTAFAQAETALDTAFINNAYFNVYYDGVHNVEGIINYVHHSKSNKNSKEVLKELPQKLIHQKINVENAMPILETLTQVMGVGTEIKDWDSKELVSQFRNLDAYFTYLLQCIGETNKKRSGKNASHHIVKEITEYIKINYNQKIMVNDLAQRFFLNPSYLSNLFKMETGKSFTSFLVECRLRKAVELLENTDLSLYEISTRVGYEDYFHFSKLFKKHMDISPANYRKSKTGGNI